MEIYFNNPLYKAPRTSQTMELQPANKSHVNLPSKQARRASIYVSRSFLFSTLVIFGILELALITGVAFAAYFMLALPNTTQTNHLNETEALTPRILTGPPGPPGERGAKGDIGKGEKGEEGAKGSTGSIGPTGSDGAVGGKGEKGDAGPPGLRGSKGMDGATGMNGSPGRAGEKGEKGESGQKGVQGDPGPIGEAGAPGSQGPPGQKGQEGRSEGRIQKIRLRNGTEPGHRFGRVEVFAFGTWGTVCNDRFENEEATVICRSLGYNGGEAKTNTKEYGKGSGDIWVDNLNCSGGETNINDCTFSMDHNCGHHEDVGVVCSG